MLYGKVLRPPSFGATLTSFRQNETKAMPGVFVVRDGDFVGAAAPTEREAQAALDALKVEWKEIPQISNKELFAYLKQNGAAKTDRKSTRLNSSHRCISYAVFCLKKKKKTKNNKRRKKDKRHKHEKDR